MSKPFIIGLLAALALFIGSRVYATRLQPQSSDDSAAKYERQLEFAEATPIQLGQMTEQQRRHSRLYAPYSNPLQHMPVRKLMAKRPGKDVQTTRLVGLESSDLPSAEDMLKQLAAESDAVVIGQVLSKNAQLTEEETWVFTDYQFQANEIIKNNGQAPIHTGQTLTVSRAGGKVVIDGVIFTAEDESFPPLTKGSEVLLFLQYVPETKSYFCHRVRGTIELTRDTARVAARVGAREILPKARQEFMNIVHSVLSE